MEKEKAIRLLKTKKGQPSTDYQLAEALQVAISALEFRENYDKFWEEVKTASKNGKETEIHHSGRVFRIREVAQ